MKQLYYILFIIMCVGCDFSLFGRGQKANFSIIGALCAPWLCSPDHRQGEIACVGDSLKGGIFPLCLYAPFQQRIFKN